jgi:hypothetical protein
MRAWGASACALIVVMSLAGPARAGDVDQVREKIAGYFRGAGYQEFQVKALVRHAEIESGFQPCVLGLGGSRFTYQWLGERLERLYALSGHRMCPTLDAQLAFADSELKLEPLYRCFWRATNYRDALSALRRGFGRGHC